MAVPTKQISIKHEITNQICVMCKIAPLTWAEQCDIIITIYENYPLIRSCEVGKAVGLIVTITIAISISVPVC